VKHEGPRYEEHKKRMRLRRHRQRVRGPSVDSRILHLSKNSSPAYRKDFVRIVKEKKDV